MADLYADENFSKATVDHLRSLGHDVLTAFEAGQANQALPDEDVLAFAIAHGRAVLTINRQHFTRLHRRSPNHLGIIACTDDRNFARQARHVQAAIVSHQDLANRLIRVYRGP